MKFFKYKRAGALFFSTILSTSLFFTTTVTATESNIISDEEVEVSTTSTDGWPTGPSIDVGAAILIEANTGTILYEKNMHDQLYPASITKLLTGYIAASTSDMDEIVTFSSDAVYSIDWRNDANMGIKVGEQITMEQTLYGVLVGSANEAAYAIGEHISGSIESFADLMNETAIELGCTDSHFVNANGIHDDNHYTSAYDMSLIAQAFFSNEMLCNMSSTLSYQVPYSSTQSNENLIVWAKSKLLPGKTYEYEYLVGTKTGYTDEANQTLVSCAEKDGMKLICVILNAESPEQFTSTVELFDFGFNNFSALTVSDLDTEYDIESTNFFSTNSNDLFGDSSFMLELDDNSYVIVPNSYDSELINSTVSYENMKENSIGTIEFSYKDIAIGSISVNFIIPETTSFDFDATTITEEPIVEIDNDSTIISSNFIKDYIKELDDGSEENTFIVNVKNIMILVIFIFIILFIVCVCLGILHHKRMQTNRRYRARRFADKNSSSYIDIFRNPPDL